VKPPIFVQTIFGILGGIGPHPEDLMHMKRLPTGSLGTIMFGPCSARDGTSTTW
jgi:uncharacterized protein (DUF849 family)